MRRTRRPRPAGALSAALAAASLCVLAASAAAARPLAKVAAPSTSSPASSSSAASAAAAPPPPPPLDFDPTVLGPCAPSVVANGTLALDPSAAGCKGAGCRLNVTVTAPASAAAAPPPPPRCTRPLPVVLVLPGFAARASMYRPYAELLASWGYAAVSYEAPLLACYPPLRDAYEGSPAFVALVGRAAADALANASASSSSSSSTSSSASSSSASLDPRSLRAPMAIGHSRGGKIAALGLASGALATAALLDPVDGGLRPFFPPKTSAVDALRRSPPAHGALIVQAGVQGPCNAAAVGGDSLFWKALAAGGGGSGTAAVNNSGGDGKSWRTVLPKAGHGAFAALGDMLQPVAGLVCGGSAKFGGLPERKAVQLARTVAMEWIERYWEGVGAGGGGGGDEGGGNGAGDSAAMPAEAAFCGFVARKAQYMTAVERSDGTPVCGGVSATRRL